MSEVERQAFREWQRDQGRHGGGYRRESTAAIVASTAERRSSMDSGSVHGGAVQWDLQHGWSGVDQWIKTKLYPYADTGEVPAVGDPGELTARIKKRREQGKASHGLEAALELVRAVDALGAAMSWNRPERAQETREVASSRHHRGVRCLSCGEAVGLHEPIRWDERRGQIWHLSCWES